MEWKTAKKTTAYLRPGGRTWKKMKKNWVLYLFLMPAVVYLATFAYAPMYGLIIAFKDYVPSKGIWGSSWAGLKWFRTFFETPRFWQILGNTLALSISSLVLGFPFPIILALIINGIQNSRNFRRQSLICHILFRLLCWWE